MSVRRSTRVSGRPDIYPSPTNGDLPAAAAAANISKKRGRPSKAADDGAPTPVKKAAASKKGTRDFIKEMNASSVDDGDATGGADVSAIAMPPPPTTPNKRRRVAKSDPKVPPITPTPSAIGLMTSNSGLGANYSSGDIDDVGPPPTRPAEPHHTNAILATPGGTQVPPTYSNFEDTPSKPGIKPTTTTRCLLDDACAHLIKTDATLKTVVERHHCHVFSPEGLAETIDPFRSLASGIISQQVSGAAAKSIKNKFIGLFPPSACPNGFPTPKVVSKTDLTRLREAGLSQRKAEYIQGLAQKFHDGDLTVPMLMNGSDEEVMEKLVAVRGLGKWSVEMFMCFGLKRMDVFSVGDLGVERGMAAYMGRDVAKLKAKGGKNKYMSAKEMEEIAEKFRPYRSLFMWYMWRIEDVEVDALQNNA